MNTSLFKTILLGGLCAGALDITAACISGMLRGGSVMRVLQSVAGGWLGTATFQGGAKTAALGLVFHFLIATIWTAIYAAMNTKLPLLTQHAVLCGAAYGVIVYLLMYNVVIPLSAYHSKPFNQPLSALIVSIPIHIFCVGLPIALIVKQLRSV